jgi:two-component system CheB/CheR fusion protein
MRAGRHLTRRRPRTWLGRIRILRPIQGVSFSLHPGGFTGPDLTCMLPSVPLFEAPILSFGYHVTFPIVAIGASAGGLEAITELLSSLPSNTGMAYIAVQHLNPDHESLLSEILTKKTSLPVMQIQGDLEVEKDHVYLIAPNTTITLVDNVIRVVPRASGVHHPADILFTSVAQDRADLAIGVVLSGGDGDGALGLQAIKQAGGITFAQEPESARFPSMPQAAIDTGCVDFVKRPSEISRELMRLVHHPYLRVGSVLSRPSEEPVETATVSDEAALRRIFRRLRSTHGVDFSHYKRSTLRRRLERRMAFKKTEELEEYAVLLESDGAETAALYQDFLIRVTGFFRDPQSFDTLAQRVFPSVCESRPSKAPVRIWVPGCASGEEAYSIAIALMEYLGDRTAPAGIQIFGTDVSDAALEKARAGVYLENITQEVSRERLERFFVKQNGHYRIAKSIRDLCVFARHDITRDPPFSRLDLVSCRNLLIYLDATVQRRVMGSFHYALRPKGFLLLGPSETVGPGTSLFEVSDQHNRLYTPNATATGADGFRHGAPPSYLRSDDTASAADPVVIESDLAQREADRILLARFAPASVLIDDALNILQFRGETAPYLEHASGPSSLNLQRVVRPELLIEIAPAIQKARETGVEVRCAALRLDEQPEVNVEVIPLRRASPERCYLILFEGSTRTSAARRAQQVVNPLPESEKDRRLAQLEHETASLRDYLQATIEEHEASQEELKSAHEEVLSASEEFQSTNEELETAKEELQSANEELTTTNEELRQRNRELGVLNATVEQSRQSAERAQAQADIIVESVREPLLVLDDKLHVVRANRAYYADFDTRAGETEGQLLYHIGEGQWNVPALREGLLDVLARSETLEDFEINHIFPTTGRRSMSLNARKMHGDTAQPALILLAIADVTARNDQAERLAQEVKRKDEFLAMLAHELRNPLAPIATAVKILRGGPGDPSTAGLHDMIDRQTRRLARLVDELLDIGRFSRGLIELKREPLDLATIVQQTVAAIRPQLEARQHELSVALPKEPVCINGDPIRLEQIISNLLDNASKYTNPGGRIAVTLRRTTGEAIVSVRDNGIGLAADTLEEIFGLFTQVNRFADHAGEGLGIGLTLVRRVIELHGGRIEARSGGLGQGSEFIVRLPCVSAPDDSRPSVGVKVEKPLIGTAAVPRRVLIVDDNEDAGQSLVLLVRSWGHEVAYAADGPSAIAIAEKFEPQTALVDIGMPGMNGYQLARHFRAVPRYVDLQLVAMTGFGREEDRNAALAAGFDSHMVKPVVLDELEALLVNGMMKGADL